MSRVNLVIATQEDKEDILDLLHEFFLESPYRGEVFEEDKVSTLVDRYISDLDKLILLSKKDGESTGIVVGHCHEFLFNHSKICTETVWFVKEGHRKGSVGIRLKKAFEYWAFEVMGAEKLAMSHLNTPRIGRFYEKNGFTKLEETYLKEK